MTHPQMNLDLNADLPRGIDLARIGMARALMATESKGPGWTEVVLAALAKWAKLEAKPFPFERFRMDMAHKLPAPKSHKAWGALAQVAVRRKVIVGTGDYVKAQSAKTHNHPVQLYIAG